MLRFLLILAVLVSAAPDAAAQAYGMSAGQLMGQGDPNLLYQLTFNDDPPYGTDENSSGTQTCSTHGGTVTGTATFLCECKVGGCGAPPEGDAVFLAQAATGKAQVDWFDKWDGVADTWIRLHIIINDTSAATAQIFSFRNGASGDDIGGVYRIQFGQHITNTLVLFCDGTSVNWDGAYTDNTWHTWLIRINTDDGSLRVFRDGSPTATRACVSGAGGDSGTPFDGFRVEIEDDAIQLRYDGIRVYDGRPR